MLKGGLILTKTEMHKEELKTEMNNGSSFLNVIWMTDAQCIFSDIL